MAIEIKQTGAKSFATLYQIQSKKAENVNNDKFDVALSEKLQSTENVIEGTASFTNEVTNSDKVLFTNVIQEMRRRIDASSEQPVDLEKIARIRRAIEEGTYVVNADSIAEKMMQYVF